MHRWAAVGLALLIAVAARAEDHAPAAALAQLDVFVGAWTCDGVDGAVGEEPRRTFRSRIAIARDLGGFWFAGRYDRDGVRRLFFWGWDSLVQGFLGGWLDGRGQASTQTSTGWQGDNLAMMGHAIVRGTKASAREMLTRPKAGAFTRRYEWLDVNTWVRLSEETCRRR